MYAVVCFTEDWSTAYTSDRSRMTLLGDKLCCEWQIPFLAADFANKIHVLG